MKTTLPSNDETRKRYGISNPLPVVPIIRPSLFDLVMNVARYDQGTTLIEEARANKRRKEAETGRQIEQKTINRSKTFFILPTRQAAAYNLQLQKSLRALVALTNKTLVKEIGPLLRANKAATGLDSSTRWDGVVDDTQAIARGILAQHGQSFGTAWQTSVASDTAVAISDFQRRQFGKVLSPVLGIDPVLFEPFLLAEIQSFTAENVALIKSINATYLRQVEQIVVTGVRGGATSKTMSASIRTRFGVSSSRSTLIARDQATKFYGNLNGLRQREAGIAKYVWRTSNDERVREDHDTKDGEVFRWSKPPADTGHPGQDIQCRCVAEPIVVI